MENIRRYEDPQYKGKIEAVSPENVKLMQQMDPIRAKYFNRLRTNSQLNIGGRSKSISSKNKKKYNKLSRRRYSKKNKKSMKRK